MQQLADEYEPTWAAALVVVDPTGTSVADSGADTAVSDFSNSPRVRAKCSRTATVASGTRHSDTLDA